MADRPATYYAATVADTTQWPALAGAIDADIAIVGGGFTGVNTALELAERGLKVVLLEANRIGWGATGRNGGQVTGSLSGEPAYIKQLTRLMGEEAAADFVWNLKWRGHDIIRRRVETYAIACDLTPGHMQAAYSPAHLPELEALKAEADRRGMGDKVRLIPRGEIRDWLDTPLYHGGLLNTHNFHLHPLNLCLGEARAAQQLGAQIFEQTPVTDIVHGDTVELITPNGRVRARAVLLAGNAYHRLGRPRLGGILFPASLANMATVRLPDEVATAINPHRIAVYDTRFVLDYYRLTADNRLLFGGGANYSGRDSADVAAELRPRLESTFPRLKGVDIEFAWTGMAGITINRLPQLGRIAANVFYAQGYSGHGIATTHIVAEIMGEALSGHLERFDTFAALRHWRVPFGDTFGQHLLAIGMWYYKMREKLG